MIGAASLLAISLTIFTLNSNGPNEEKALEQVERFFERACMGDVCEFNHFYDLEVQLVQREEKELGKPGIYQLSGGAAIDDNGLDHMRYVLFDTEVAFSDGIYRLLDSPFTDIDYEKEDAARKKE